MRTFSWLVILLLSIAELSDLAFGMPDETKLDIINTLMALGVVVLLVEVLPTMIRKVIRDTRYRAMCLRVCILAMLISVLSLLGGKTEIEEYWLVGLYVGLLCISVAWKCFIRRYMANKQKKAESSPEGIQ